MNPEPSTGRFHPTRWSLVLRAQASSADAGAALSELCEAYYQPVFRFLCGRGHAEEEARELTHGFFRRILERGVIGQANPERGRFRSYLLGALKHFVLDMRDFADRQKRGGGQSFESLEAGAEEGVRREFPDTERGVSDEYFDRQWAFTVMDRAFKTLEAEFAGEGKSEQFDVLKPWLVGETNQLSQRESAARLGWTESAMKVAVHRLRKRYREAIRAEIGQTVGSDSEVDAELRYLVEVLARNL